MSPSSQRVEGDPAFEGSDAVTHAPIDEESRFDSSAGPEVLKRPFPWVLIGTGAAIVVIGIVAGASAGWVYLIPIALVAVVIIVFAVTNWFLGNRAERVPDAIPNFDTTGQEGAGGNPDQADEPSTHEDMERSPGQ